ncbi:MAG: hypothetical protein ACOCSJ_03710 [Candidatus Natronoplasma sp.]
MVSYLFASSGLYPTVYNLLVIMLFFFLLIGIWFYARNTLFISGIEGSASDEYNVGLSKFRRSSLNEILTTVLWGSLLSILAFSIMLYSSLGMTMGSLAGTLLMVGLSASVFFITFLMIKLFYLEETRTSYES